MALWNSARLTCPSDAIRARQGSRSSGLIRLHQGSSGLIRPHQVSSGLIRSHQVSSGFIRSHQGSSRPRTRTGSVVTLGGYTRWLHSVVTLGGYTRWLHSEVLTCPSPSASQLRKRSSTRAEFARSAFASCSANREAIRGADRWVIREVIREVISAPSSHQCAFASCCRAIGGASTAISAHQNSSVLISAHHWQSSLTC